MPDKELQDIIDEILKLFGVGPEDERRSAVFSCAINAMELGVEIAPYRSETEAAVDKIRYRRAKAAEELRDRHRLKIVEAK